jgi:hypothetical protein
MADIDRNGPKVLTDICAPQVPKYFRSKGQVWCKSFNAPKIASTYRRADGLTTTSYLIQQASIK